MKKKIVWVVLILVVLLLILFFIFPELFDSRVFYSGEDESMTKEQELISQKKPLAPVLLPLDTVAYDVKMLAIANNPPPKLSTTKVVKDPKTGKETTITIEPKPAPLTSGQSKLCIQPSARYCLSNASSLITAIYILKK